MHVEMRGTCLGTEHEHYQSRTETYTLDSQTAPQDKDAAVAKFRRWLRPGGRLAFNNPLVC